MVGMLLVGFRSAEGRSSHSIITFPPCAEYTTASVALQGLFPSAGGGFIFNPSPGRFGSFQTSFEILFKWESPQTMVTFSSGVSEKEPAAVEAGSRAAASMVSIPKPSDSPKQGSTY